MFIPLISQNLNETTREVFKEQKEEIRNAKDRGEESNTSGGDTGSSQKQQARESDAMSQERHGAESAESSSDLLPPSKVSTDTFRFT